MTINFKNNITVDIKNFKYKDNDKFAIQDINLTIKKGDKIGIIGPSGSGKSTFMEILLGIWKPQNGQVKIDGNLIQSVGSSSFQNQIHVMTEFWVIPVCWNSMQLHNSG